MAQDLGKRRVGHAEAGAHVLGEQSNGIAVGYGIGLRQVANGFNQQALAIDVTRVRIAFATPSAHLRRHRNRKNFGHAQLGKSQRIKTLFWQEARLELQYNPRRLNFQPNFCS
jgi:hypothetical protein